MAFRPFDLFDRNRHLTLNVSDGHYGYDPNPRGVEAHLNDAANKHPIFRLAASDELDKYGDKRKSTYLSHLLWLMKPDYRRGAQQIGSCFVAGTAVTMADGTIKPIETVEPGEYVVSATGAPRRVTNIFSRMYRGDLMRIQVKGQVDPLVCTADHKIKSFPGIPFGRCQPGAVNKHPAWLEAESLAKGSRVHVPFPQFHETSAVSKDMAWLLGLFLAEGSVRRYHSGPNAGKPNGIQWTCGAHETNLINRLKMAIRRVFKREPKIYNHKNKPTVTYVRINSVKLARRFDRWFSGNVYTKSVPSHVFTASKRARRSFLRGWNDGDGWMVARKNNAGAAVTGVTVSPAAARDCQRLALSLGIKTSVTTRPAYKRSRQSYSVSAYGTDAVAIYHEMELEASTKPNSRERVADGLALPVSSVERIEGQTLPVYCLEVETEHTFVANNIAVHNCVGWGAELACTVLTCKQQLKRRRKTFLEASTEALYGGSRVEARGKTFAGWSDGSYGAAAAKFARDFGVLYRLDYSQETGNPEHDLTQYSGRKEKHWGAYGCGGQKDGGKLDQIAKDHPVKTTSLCQSFEDVADSICVFKCPVTIASMYGASMDRDRYGECRWTRRWAHQMVILDVRLGERPAARIFQSWGPSVASGPSGDEYSPDLPWSDGTPENILGFSWWAPAEDVDAICRGNDSHAFGDVDGWKVDRYDYTNFGW